MSTPELHPSLEHLAFLVGEWEGVGVMGYPTVESSRYAQEISFSHDGRPFLAYISKTWLIDEDGNRVRPSGVETGFWRAGKNPRDVEVLLAHPTGFVEISVGEVVFHKIELVTDLLARTETAKEVSGLKRLYGLVEGDLAYAIDMAAVGEPLQAHLSARLKKIV
ncbi:MAG: FABP family protein [Mycobacteriales bacterium]